MDNDPGVPLEHYRQHNAAVLLICEAGDCSYVREIPLEDVIGRLNARGLKGDQVGIREVAKYTVGNCPDCHRRSWATRPAFPNRPGQDGLTRRS